MKLKSIQQNDIATLAFFDTCHREIHSVTPSLVNLPELIRQQVAAQRLAFNETFTQMQRSREHVQGLKAQKRQQEDALRKLLRHVFQNVRRKLKDPQMTAATLNHFGLDANGRLGKNQDRMKTPTQLALIALEANRAAADYGFNFMQDPDAAVIEAMIYDLDAIYANLQQAEDDQRRWLEKLREVRFEAGSLQMLIANFLKVQMRGRDETFVRNVMRAYGFEYVVTRSAKDLDANPADDPESSEVAA